MTVKILCHLGKLKTDVRSVTGRKRLAFLTSSPTALALPFYKNVSFQAMVSDDLRSGSKIQVLLPCNNTRHCDISKVLSYI